MESFSKELRIGYDIELDAYSVMQTGEKGNPSPWLIHSSWTFDQQTKTMADAISDNVKQFLTQKTAFWDSNPIEIGQWCNNWGKVAFETINAFKKSTTYAEALGNYICLDALMGGLIFSLAQLRLNANIQFQRYDAYSEA